MRSMQLLSLFTVALLGGCIPYRMVDPPNHADRVRGDVRQVQSKVTTLGSFTQVQVGGAIEAKIEFGSESKIEIRAVPSVVQQVTTAIHDGVLEVAVDKDNRTGKIQVTIYTPSLESIRALSASSITVSDWNSKQVRVSAESGSNIEVEGDWDQVSVRLTGASNLLLSGTEMALVDAEVSAASDFTATGNVKQFLVYASGGSSVDADDLFVSSATVEVSGGSNLRVRAVESITGKASGGSQITTIGRPRKSKITTDTGSSSNAED